jgi:hypothetical protein
MPRRAAITSSSLDHRQLLTALRAFRKGDFSRPLQRLEHDGMTEIELPNEKTCPECGLKMIARDDHPICMSCTLKAMNPNAEMKSPEGQKVHASWMVMLGPWWP